MNKAVEWLKLLMACPSAVAKMNQPHQPIAHGPEPAPPAISALCCQRQAFTWNQETMAELTVPSNDSATVPCLQLATHACMHACMHAYITTYISAYIHCIHAYIYIYVIYKCTTSETQRQTYVRKHVHSGTYQTASH